MRFSIRAAGPEDREGWLRMRRVLWPDCPDGDHRAEIGAYFDRHEPPMPAPCGPSAGAIAAFVAERVGGGLCGFLEASIRSQAEGVDPQPVGYIEGWYVEPDARRQGVGRALVEAAEGWARSEGCRWMASDALIENVVSLASHTRLGYREVERLVHFLKDLGR